MTASGTAAGDGALVGEVIATQLEYFRNTTPPCRGVRLPDGVLLRHTPSAALYFYLRTAVENGAIRTHVYASDSPYDRQKASLGVVSTPMFDPAADDAHLEKVEVLIRAWAEFVAPHPGTDRDFRSFAFDS